MVEPRPPITTVSFIDDYCNHYQDLFDDVRTQLISGGCLARSLKDNDRHGSIYLLRATYQIRGFDFMSAHDANAPAHPTDPTMLERGLSKREYIAAIALAATDSSTTAQERAKQAVELADALFKALYG